MRLVNSDQGRFTFSLSNEERRLLLAVLRRYPLVPSAYQPLSKSAPTPARKANQRILDEALAEQRLENKRQLETLLADQCRFQETEAGCRMILSDADFQWLLQILNDVRVGSWILLGSPEKNLWDLEWTETTALHAWTMEMAGEFEMTLLKAVQPPDPA